MVNKDDKVFNGEYFRLVEFVSNVSKFREKIIVFEEKLETFDVDEPNRYRSRFYRNLIESSVDVLDKDDLDELVKQILVLCDSLVDDRWKYKIVMDTCILYAINLYYDGDIIRSKEYFGRAIDYGSSRIQFAKAEYFDALNCAYSWLGVIYYQESVFDEAYKLFDTAIKNYNLVKDDPNYFVKEDKVIDICKDYIDKIEID